jgi:hypothetical protein
VSSPQSRACPAQPAWPRATGPAPTDGLLRDKTRPSRIKPKDGRSRPSRPARSTTLRRGTSKRARQAAGAFCVMLTLRSGLPSSSGLSHVGCRQAFALAGGKVRGIARARRRPAFRPSSLRSFPRPSRSLPQGLAGCTKSSWTAFA